MLLLSLNNLSLLFLLKKLKGKNSIDNSNKEYTQEESLSITTIIIGCLLYSITHFNLGISVETIFINLGPIILNIFLLSNWIKSKRLEYEQLQNCYSSIFDQKLIINNCQYFALSERETEIVTLLFHGLKRQQIAEKLFISIRTVDKHIERIFLKTGVSSRERLMEKLRFINKL
ncbi:helix-turn-helix transcriptional regulator [Sphingobacterium sp. HMA12]|uniref:helix-turn-helix transcriptional regulator n=1 Tax=Sphingobacterium sp. HMA12 TaxID=2050894 RepID=UPI00352A5B52